MESEFLDWLRSRLPAPSPDFNGLGDDAAVISWHGPVIVTSDMLTEGVHFRLVECDAASVGRKALAVNLSDLAAMAARPRAAIVSLVVPRCDGLPLAQAVYEGLIPLAEQFGLCIAGGDTNSWNGPLVISLTAFGEVGRTAPWRRGGASPGDQILVTGSFGGSILGKHLHFQPRVNEALLLAARYNIHAAIDVSDGLSLDLAQVARESHCGAVLDVAHIPVADEAFQLAAAAGDSRSALDHALSDGEDFELLLAVPSDEAQRLLQDQPLDVPLTRVGQFVAERGLWKRTPSGPRQPLVPSGFRH